MYPFNCPLVYDWLNVSNKYSSQKKLRITYFIIFEHTILNSRSCSGHNGNCMKLLRQHQLAYESIYTNFQDDLMVIFENLKVRPPPQIEKGKTF